LPKREYWNNCIAYLHKKEYNYVTYIATKSQNIINLEGKSMSNETINEMKLKVMVVDDQASVCREVTEFLKKDYEVSAFKSGADALEYLHKNVVDLIILDYYMPEMTGFETLMEIRLRKSTAHIPVIFLTTELNDRMETEMVTRGAEDYLRKPIDGEVLIACVEKHLAANKQ